MITGLVLEGGGIEEPRPALLRTPASAVQWPGSQSYQIDLADLFERPLALKDLAGGDTLRGDHLDRARAAVGHRHQGQGVIGAHRLPAACQACDDTVGRQTTARSDQRYSSGFRP